jgi:hypothetical protein
MSGGWSTVSRKLDRIASRSQDSPRPKQEQASILTGLGLAHTSSSLSVYYFLHFGFLAEFDSTEAL